MGEEDAEAKSLARKFWVGAILTVPILVLSFGKMFPSFGVDQLVPATINNWIQLVLATVVVFWCGGIFFVRAWRSVVNRSLNMFTLIGLGVGAAYFTARSRRFRREFSRSRLSTMASWICILKLPP